MLRLSSPYTDLLVYLTTAKIANMLPPFSDRSLFFPVSKMSTACLAGCSTAGVLRGAMFQQARSRSSVSSDLDTLAVLHCWLQYTLSSMKNKLLLLPISYSHVAHTNRLPCAFSFALGGFNTSQSGGNARFLGRSSSAGAEPTGSSSWEDHDSMLESDTPSISGRTVCQI